MTPGDVADLTLSQVRGWYLEPMARIRKQADGASQPTRGGRMTDSVPTLDEFKAGFVGLMPVDSKPPEWWENAYRSYLEGLEEAKRKGV